MSDAQIAALTIEHGGILYTADRDFARFLGSAEKSARLDVGLSYPTRR